MPIRADDANSNDRKGRLLEETVRRLIAQLLEKEGAPLTGASRSPDFDVVAQDSNSGRLICFEVKGVRGPSLTLEQAERRYQALGR